MKEELIQLRDAMKEDGIDALIIPTSDFHDTEYVCDYFACRKHYSGFTGSAGTLVVTPDQAALWTDGRYYIQAAHELEGSGIELMKASEEETPSIEEWIVSLLQPGQTAGFDGRTTSWKDAEKYKKAFSKAGIELKTDVDPAGRTWKDRPALPATKTFHYDEKYNGESVASKLARVREAMKEAGARWHLISKVDEIAWLFNLRAYDIPYFPVALSYALIGEEGGTLYIDSDRLDEDSAALLKENGIQVRGYHDVYEDAAKLEGPVLADPDFLNSHMVSLIEQPVFAKDPIVAMKAVKNETELEGAREAHIKDGAAVIRFWKWLEKAMAEGEPVTEISAADKLRSFRAQMPDYLEDSFATISACGANAAMAHYHPDEANPVPLKNEGLFLVDSGGQYLQGTTDITRTFVMGDLTDEERRMFTRVLQGHIDLASAAFLKGVRGLNLDILARRWLWNENMDYNHGTGHGVGALSNVHEAPNGFRWKVVPERNDSCVLEPGMITSNEPGAYAEGKYGIRHENLMAVVEDEVNGFGHFYRHEPLTMVPFDVRGLDLSLMTPDQIDWLNEYHQTVYDKTSPWLDEEEKVWLKEKTAPIHR